MKRKMKVWRKCFTMITLENKTMWTLLIMKWEKLATKCIMMVLRYSINRKALFFIAQLINNSVSNWLTNNSLICLTGKWKLCSTCHQTNYFSIHLIMQTVFCKNALTSIRFQNLFSDGVKRMKLKILGLINISSNKMKTLKNFLASQF